MYPYYVLNLSKGATPEQVEARYLELVRRYPPDRNPEQFRLIAAARAALKDERRALETQMLHGGRDGLRDCAFLPDNPVQGPRPRIPAAELRAMLLTEVGDV
jgi:curved DNA-binding protein CbpA